MKNADKSFSHRHTGECSSRILENVTLSANHAWKAKPCAHTHWPGAESLNVAAHEAHSVGLMQVAQPTRQAGNTTFVSRDKTRKIVITSASGQLKRKVGAIRTRDWRGPW